METNIYEYKGRSDITQAMRPGAKAVPDVWT